MKHALTVAFIASAFAAVPAAAAPIVYTSAAAFGAATTGVTTNGFENVAANGSTWILSSGSYHQPGFTFTQTTNNAFNSGPNGANSPYYYNWGTGAVINTPYSPDYAPNSVLTVTFDTAQTAFALDLGVFYGLGFPVQYGLPVTIGTSQGNFTVNTATTQTLTFFGLTSDTAFTSFTIGGVPNPAGFSPSIVLDNLSFGSANVTAPVPEPATWAMMLVGFGMVGAAVRRRQAKTSVAFG